MKQGSFLAAGALKSEKIRFGLVGVVNTSVDFALLFLLARIFGVPVLVANMISTLCAVAVSYLLNKKAVFKNADKQGLRSVLLFVAVTLAGLWGLQSLVIAIVTGALGVVGDDALILLIAKIVATITSLVWNYVWYSQVIFRKKS